MIIETEVKKAQSMRELMDPITMRRRLGLVYYQQLEGGGIIPRTVSADTDAEHVKTLISQGRLYIPIQTIIAETK
ncbi:hypothetical protein C943_03273 [Mariniradius saccharolyticus AK6]|uniref:Uncharacterized protein n=1 Tax=Mariniradius saccharolyticus AK6 TaxID=1239962 RepID=M7YBL9_9BACT|nr:hypothetical protein [Mariniradius saccharolyticus]EMS34586.1 hypothetical protein C943_03273 [Mariniradius saccharolyticus AK6]